MGWGEVMRIDGLVNYPSIIGNIDADLTPTLELVKEKGLAQSKGKAVVCG